jgi:hypothetical protein
MRKALIQAMSEVEQTTCALWDELLDARPAGCISAMLGRGNPEELRTLTVDQLELVFRLARLGHTSVMLSKMQEDPTGSSEDE